MNFLDLSNNAQTDARVTILPVPYEVTTSYGKGTKNGPDAIIKASAHIEAFDEELEFEPYKIGIKTEEPIDFGQLVGKEAVELIESAASKIVEEGRFPLSLGGEHTITTGLVKALLKKYPKIHIVHLDAHADMRDEYEGTKWSHACVMKRLDDLGLNFTSIGIRSLCKEQWEYIKDKKQNYFFAHQIASDPGWMKKALALISGPVYLTLDVDVFDATVIPHTGTPEPGGLNWYQVTNFLKLLMQSKQVVGADVVELAPSKESAPSDYTAAKLAYKIIGYLGSKQSVIAQ